MNSLLGASGATRNLPPNASAATQRSRNSRANLLRQKQSCGCGEKAGASRNRAGLPLLAFQAVDMAKMVIAGNQNHVVADSLSRYPDVILRHFDGAALEVGCDYSKAFCCWVVAGQGRMRLEK